MSQHTQQSKADGGKIHFGPWSLFSRAQNRFGGRYQPKHAPRPGHNDIKTSLRAANGLTYRMEPDGSIRRNGF